MTTPAPQFKPAPSHPWRKFNRYFARPPERRVLPDHKLKNRKGSA